MEQNLNEDEKEKLRLENEIRKIKLSLEKGAKFIEDDNMPALPPEVENEFLNYIEQLELINDDSPMISVYEKIGEPLFKKVIDIGDAEIGNELDMLCEMLIGKGVAVDSIYDVEDREMYRFITEDLFKHMMYSMITLEGIITQFTYEEFYPNMDEDIKKNALSFYETFFNQENDYYKYHVAEKSNSWCQQFRNAYSYFKTNHFEILDYTYDSNNATLHFEIDFLAILDERQTHQFKGKGSMNMIYEGDWLITKIEFPEVK